MAVQSPGHFLSFRDGAKRRSRIHNHQSGSWIPGSRTALTPWNDYASVFLNSTVSDSRPSGE